MTKIKTDWVAVKKLLKSLKPEHITSLAIILTSEISSTSTVSVEKESLSEGAFIIPYQ